VVCAFHSYAERERADRLAIEHAIEARIMSSTDVYSGSGDDTARQENPIVRTTLNIDDELLEEARRMTGISEKSVLVREGLRALVERESARRLARLGGSEPELGPVPRRQSSRK
jgi:Arc/MetJ family transcription regulator